MFLIFQAFQRSICEEGEDEINLLVDSCSLSLSLWIEEGKGEKEAEVAAAAAAEELQIITSFRLSLYLRLQYMWLIFIKSLQT